jgi:hypothetical protein
LVTLSSAHVAGESHNADRGICHDSYEDDAASERYTQRCQKCKLCVLTFWAAPACCAVTPSQRLPCCQSAFRGPICAYPSGCIIDLSRLTRRAIVQIGCRSKGHTKFSWRDIHPCWRPGSPLAATLAYRPQPQAPSLLENT